MASDSTSDQTTHPSMIGGHAKYLQGAISSALGYPSGEETKGSAIQEMRRASVSSGSGTVGSPTSESQAQQPMQSSILGTVEKKLGELTGCEGLVQEGDQRIPVSAKGGSEAASGTG